MKYKVLLLDFDGVLSPGRYFSDIYSEEFGVDLETMKPFFRGPKDELNLGKGDLKESLKELAPSWQWKGSLDELIHYWMHADSDIDERVVSEAKNFQKQGGRVFLVSDQEKYRTEFIWDERGLGNWMDGRFISWEIGFLKEDERFFRYVLEKLKNVLPNEILFFDDSLAKVETAKKLGIESRLYTGFDSFKLD